MHELPDLLSETVGDTAVTDVIEIGGGDTIAVTDHRTYLYRSEGLLKDESIETFDHAVERLSLRTKRRKSSIHLETIDSEASFTVPSDISDSVVEAIMRGVLLTNDVVSADERLEALFRFSELTLVVTDRRVFEHVGSAVWDGDFETVEYADLSGLDFERGSVATQVVLETRERRRRVKVPNEHAGIVQREIQDAVFGFHDVESIEALRAELAEQAEEADQEESATESDPDPDSATASESTDDDFVSAGWSPSSDGESAAGGDDDGKDAPDPATSRAATDSAEPAVTADGIPEGTDLGVLTERVDALSERIDRQTELIESQQALIEQLVDELRRGR